MIIAFSGVDCSGKSTQIEFLRQYFISMGKTCTVFWYRPGYSRDLEQIKRVIRKIHALLKKRSSGADPSSTQTDPKPRKSILPPSIWLLTALADTLIQWGAKLRALSKKYDVVICDRYIFDALMDIYFKYPEIGWSNDILLALARIFPKPDHSILLWLPHEEMVARANRKNEPFPDPEEIRDLRWNAYNLLKQNADAIQYSVIDTTGPIEQNRCAILNAITR